MSHFEFLANKIQNRTAVSGIVGLGYVGLPLAVEFARAGLPVLGFDITQSKVDTLNRGESYIQDVPTSVLGPHVASGKLSATSDFARMAEVDTINICVPTPLRKTKDPDMSYIVAATEKIAQYLHPGMLIILESTTYPGTTDELLLPMLEKSGLKCGVDFFLCFSPERVDPGNPNFQTYNIPKVVGGITPACTELGRMFYAQSLQTVVPVSSTSVAEMVKLLENTFRMINIGMVNELALMCDRMKINVWEVIDAAATKPFGFMPFWPGPGLGGHCIPIDPHYLSWKLRAMNYRTRFIEVADDINNAMPNYVVERIALALNDDERALKGSRVLVLGAAYKRDITDWRESPAIPVIEGLLSRGAKVDYQDDFVPQIELHGHDFVGRTLQSVPLDYTRLGEWDCVVVVTDHRYFDRQKLLEGARRIVDTRNLLGELGKGHPRVTRL